MKSGQTVVISIMVAPRSCCVTAHLGAATPGAGAIHPICFRAFGCEALWKAPS